MPDIVGYRKKIAAIVPSTNTVVEHDFSVLRPHGVTFHYGRMYIADARLGSNEDFLALLGQIRESIDAAVRSVVTAVPDYLAMGMSAETFWGGVQGNREFEERMRAASGGLGVTTGATACKAALEAYGVSRIAFLSPYQRVADENVTRFFEESGFDVVRCTGLRCETATAIAEVPPVTLKNVLRDLDGPDVQAIVQVGTNLSMVGLAAQAEVWLEKPVIAINTATLWHALRTCGIDDRFEGYGRLLHDW